MIHRIFLKKCSFATFRRGVATFIGLQLLPEAYRGSPDHTVQVQNMHRTKHRRLLARWNRLCRDLFFTHQRLYNSNPSSWIFIINFFHVQIKYYRPGNIKNSEKTVLRNRMRNLQTLETFPRGANVRVIVIIHFEI